MNFEITDKIKEQDEKIIYQGLLEYNLARIEHKNPRDLGIYLQDETGEKVGGLIGNTHGNWLFVKYLWVREDQRGQKIGSALLKQAEETAKERGCRYAFLDTFSFQAPAFYEKHGYMSVFTLEEYPVTGKRYYFTKTL
ncbi:GNAT family N-acetyltransferase [Clostridium sp. WB02_MRS01]|uniref:GNAT family N-acetyltransferase n=1 Tax=Clostridium sp. WB02_MRS01 TaxID=2605777 RepID=UPI0012B18A17|nr:GNAT family N-acetyltransferase [Clostridium sp. WB02_MRS01]MSS10011.1 GNAT family N-acetyltransferase [Clostridium sp. WB02_MRS01]